MITLKNFSKKIKLLTRKLIKYLSLVYFLKRQHFSNTHF